MNSDLSIIKTVKMILLGVIMIGNPVLIFSAEYHYTVSYLNVPVLNVTISADQTNTEWTGQYHAQIKALWHYLYPIDNSYTIRAAPGSWKAKSYEKNIHEGNFYGHQQFDYPENQNEVVLPDGQTVKFPGKTYNLFSALLWIQYHPWKVGERHNMIVEIDGLLWQISLSSTSGHLFKQHNKQYHTIEVDTRFEKPVGGHRLTLRTDYLSANLPAQGRTLRAWIDPQKHLIYQISVPMGPASVQATFDPE